MREGVPFSVKSFEDIITEEKEDLLSLIYNEAEDEWDYKARMEIKVQLVAKLPYREYEENKFSFRDIDFNNDFDEYVNDYKLYHVLNQTVEQIQEDIDEDR